MSFARLLRMVGRSGGSDRSISDLDEHLRAWAKRDREQEQERDRYNRARAYGVGLGLYEWFSLNHPHEAIDDSRLLEEEYRIGGMLPWVWVRQHKLECFRRRPSSARAFCGARTRAGAPCKMRVHLREDGSLSARCKLHGGASTGARTEAGRLAIAESNRRRAKAKREARAQAAST